MAGWRTVDVDARLRAQEDRLRTDINMPGMNGYELTEREERSSRVSRMPESHSGCVSNRPRK
jgi:CheY-like chemotaxis protein